MKEVLWSFVFLVIGFVIARATLKERVREIPVTVTVPEIHNVTLPAKHDTVWRIVTQIGKRDTLVREEFYPVPAFTGYMDTTLPVVATVQGKDTVTVGVTGQAHLAISYLPSEDAFILSRFALEPLTIPLPYTERVVVEKSKVGLSATIGSRLSCGILFHYGDFGLGYEYHPKESAGEVRGIVRLFSF